MLNQSINLTTKDKKPAQPVVGITKTVYAKHYKKPSYCQDSRPYFLTAPLGVTWHHRSRDHL